MSRRSPVPASRWPGLVAAAIVVALSGAPGSRSPAQEAVRPPAPFADAARVAGLRDELTPGRLAELRRRAAEDAGPETWYDLGTALLIEGDWEGAVEPLERALAAADDPELQSAASYNLGVAQGVGARPADEGADPLTLGPAGPAAEARRAGLLRAREAFRRVLREAPEDEDARWNLEVVNRWLDQLGGAGGGGDGGGGGGEAGPEGVPREMTAEEVQRLLDAAASEERRVQEDRFQRSRARDPVAERNW